MSDSSQSAPYRLHGLKLSYFTGKLEAYLHAKGLAYTFIEMDMADFQRCAAATGVRQMPQLEAPDGTWLTDTTDIIAKFETSSDGPSLTPSDTLAAYLSLFLEDLFDEWLWRPALYYRWAFRDDRTVLSGQIVRAMLGSIPGPEAFKRWFMTARQRRVYVAGDGINAATAGQVEALYLETLDHLEPIFARRPFLFGARPCQADFGLFAPMFRHFSIDPTPAAIMRERAPHTLSWIGRMWSARPEALEKAAPLSTAPDDLGPLLTDLGSDYLLYLEANAAAFAEGLSHATYTIKGVDWRVPVSPYRVRCLSDLCRGFAALNDDDRAYLDRLFGSRRAILESTVTAPSVPTDTARPDKIVDRRWR